MKYIQALVSALIYGLILVLAIDAPAQSGKQAYATVVRIQGEARYSLGNGVWHPLVVGKVLGAGAIIQTSHDGMVDLVLGREPGMRQAAPAPDRIGFAPDAQVRGLITYRPAAVQNAIRMWSDTLLAIDKLTISDTGVDTVSDTELDLRQGRIFANVKKLSGASQYFIKIPKGIAGVRGSMFTYSADGTVEAFKSTVVLSLTDPNGNPMTIVVGEGNKFDPQTGQITPLSPDVLTLLNQVAIATDTVYVEILSFEYDLTTLFTSPTTGKL
jgi:hypothetical protein